MKWGGGSAYFQEVADHFGLEAAEPGDEATGDEAVVVLTAHEPPDIPFADYVVYNMEQLVNHDMPPYFYDRLRAAREVWDYSLVNVRHMRERGIHAKHVPYLPPITPVGTPLAAGRVGAVFVGADNDRRREWLDGLEGVVRTNDECWGTRRDTLYAHALLGLNVHYYGGPDTTILEIHRIAPMLRAGLLVVSEKSCDPYYDDLLESAGVVFIHDKRDFQETVRVLLRHPGLVKRLLRRV